MPILCRQLREAGEGGGCPGGVSELGLGAEVEEEGMVSMGCVLLLICFSGNENIVRWGGRGVTRRRPRDW